MPVPCSPGKRHPVLTQSTTRQLGVFQDLLCHLVENRNTPWLWTHKHTQTEACYCAEKVLRVLPNITQEHLQRNQLVQTTISHHVLLREQISQNPGLFWSVRGWCCTLVESELFMYGSAQWLIPPWSTLSMRATRKMSGWGHVTENTPWRNPNVRLKHGGTT